MIAAAAAANAAGYPAAPHCWNVSLPLLSRRGRAGASGGRARASAIEVARQGVRVNAVAPGTIRTPMHPAATHDALAKLQPLGRMGEVEDVVDAVLYLEAASFVTGEILHVDGGAAAGYA